MGCIRPVEIWHLNMIRSGLKARYCEYYQSFHVENFNLCGCVGIWSGVNVFEDVFPCGEVLYMNFFC